MQRWSRTTLAVAVAAVAVLAGCAAPPQTGDPADFGGTPTVPPTTLPPFGDIGPVEVLPPSRLAVPTLSVLDSAGEFYAFCGFWFFPDCNHPYFDVRVSTLTEQVDVRIRATAGCVGFGTQVRRFPLQFTNERLRWVQIGGPTNICQGSTYAVSARSVLPNDRSVSEWSDEVFHTVAGLAEPG